MKAFILFLICVLMVVGSLAAQDSDVTELVAYAPQVVALDDETPRRVFTFEAEAGEIWSISAVTVVGDLNPVMWVSDPNDALLIAVDDESHTSTDTRVEGLRIETSGTHTVELARADNMLVMTSGRLLLTAVKDSFSIPLSDLPIPRRQINLAPGEGVTLAEGIPPNKVPLRADFLLTSDENITLEIRSTARDGGGNRLLTLGADGLVLQFIQTEAETATQNTIISNADPLPSGFYSVVVSREALTVTIDGDEAVRITANALAAALLPLQVGSVGLSAPFSNTAAVQIGEPYISAQFYNADLPPSVALPPVAGQDRLLRYDDTPLAAMQELRDLGYVPDGGGLTFTVPDAIIETSDLGFHNLPLAMATPVQDFVLSFGAVLRQGDPSAACGMTLREVDAANFGSVLFSPLGNLYLMEHADGAVRDEPYAAASPFVNLGVETRNVVTLVVRGDESTLFINGTRVAAYPYRRTAGVFSLLMVLEEGVSSRCTYDSIWLWELE